VVLGLSGAGLARCAQRVSPLQDLGSDPLFEFSQLTDFMSADITADERIILHATIKVEAVLSAHGAVQFDTHPHPSITQHDPAGCPLSGHAA